MRSWKPSTDEVVFASFLAAISIVFQIGHVFTGVSTPWGMWIDIVAVPWIVAYFIKGFKTALLTAVLASFVMSLIAPSGYIGATMKFVATFPMIVVPALIAPIYTRAVGKPFSQFSFKELFVFTCLSLLVAIPLRCALVLPFNYYFAIPIFFGKSPSEAMRFFPPAIMAGLNAVQGGIEMPPAVLVCFFTRLRRKLVK